MRPVRALNTCGEPNEIELTAAHGSFHRSFSGTPVLPAAKAPSTIGGGGSLANVARKHVERERHLVANTAKLTAVHSLGHDVKDTHTDGAEQRVQIDDLATDILSQTLTPWEERTATLAASTAYDVLASQSEAGMARSLQTLMKKPPIKTMFKVYDAMRDLNQFMGGDGPRLALLSDYVSKETAVQVAIVKALAERVHQINHAHATREQLSQLKTVIAYTTDPSILRGEGGEHSLHSVYKALLGIGQDRLDAAFHDQEVFKTGGSAALVNTDWGERSDKITQNVIRHISDYINLDGVTYVNKAIYRPKRVRIGPGVYENHERRVLVVGVRELVPGFKASVHYKRLLSELGGKQRVPVKARGWQRLMTKVLKAMPWITRRQAVQCACPVHTDAENGQRPHYRWLRNVLAREPAWEANKLRLHANELNNELGAFRLRSKPVRRDRRAAAFAEHMQRRSSSNSGDAGAATPVTSAAGQPPRRQDCEACFNEARAKGLGVREALEYVRDRDGACDGECDHVRVHKSPSHTMKLLTCKDWEHKPELEYVI